MIPKSLPRTLIRGGHRFSEKIMLQQQAVPTAAGVTPE
jgi:hypothetical protein